jgi:hypothetical protein
VAQNDTFFEGSQMFLLLTLQVLMFVAFVAFWRRKLNKMFLLASMKNLKNASATPFKDLVTAYSQECSKRCL